MKVYNKNGDSILAAKEQMEILLENGWSRIKPEIKEAPAQKFAPVDAPKSKKIRKVVLKKK